MLAVGGGVPTWLYVFCAVGAGGLLVVLGAVGAWWRQWRTHERRVERTCDVVLGQEADLAIGRYVRTPGLIEVIADLQQAIGQRNGKSVMEHIEGIEEHLGIGDHK